VYPRPNARFAGSALSARVGNDPPSSAASRASSHFLFPGVKCGHLNLHNWRRGEWNPAVIAAGFTRLDEKGKLKAARTPYALRHTFASFAIAAGIPTFEIARMMGTSIEQIEKTYGHLLPDALERGRAALEAFDERSDHETKEKVN
jgi:integrase